MIAGRPRVSFFPSVRPGFLPPRGAVLAVLILLASLGDGARAQQRSATTQQRNAATKFITVHEGTDLAITVSPDHKTIVMDLQGLLYALPIGGGTAKQLTTLSRKLRIQTGRPAETALPSSPTWGEPFTSGP